MGYVQAISYEGCLMPYGSKAVISLPSPLFENVDILECKIRESFYVAINESTECCPRILNGACTLQEIPESFETNYNFDLIL